MGSHTDQWNLTTEQKPDGCVNAMYLFNRSQNFVKGMPELDRNWVRREIGTDLKLLEAVCGAPPPGISGNSHGAESGRNP